MLPLGKRNKTKPFTDAVLSLLASGAGSIVGQSCSYRSFAIAFGKRSTGLDPTAGAKAVFVHQALCDALQRL